jgi:hypothetical protein
LEEELDGSKSAIEREAGGPARTLRIQTASLETETMSSWQVFDAILRAVRRLFPVLPVQRPIATRFPA